MNKRPPVKLEKRILNVRSFSSCFPKDNTKLFKIKINMHEQNNIIKMFNKAKNVSGSKGFHTSIKFINLEKILTRTVEKDYENALLSVKTLLGINCKQDIEKAQQICMNECSGQNKFAEAMRNYFGWRMKRDYESAIGMFEEIIEQKNIENKEIISYSLLFLARCYEEGKGTEMDVPKAIELYKEAIKMKNQTAMFFMGLIYHFGREEIRPNIKKAIHLYERAIKLGCKDSINNLATIYNEGTGGIEKNTKKAVELYEKAVKMESVESMSNLANIYEHGKSEEGIETNVNKAINLYKEAIKGGDSDAMFDLAWIYLNDKFQQDLQTALVLLKRSANLGNGNAKNVLSKLTKSN